MQILSIYKDHTEYFSIESNCNIFSIFFPDFKMNTDSPGTYPMSMPFWTGQHVCVSVSDLGCSCFSASMFQFN